jgi:AMP phosphorylase
MGLHLKAKKLDIGAGKEINIVLNPKDSEALGVREGDLVQVGIGEADYYAEVNESEEMVQPGIVGLFEEIWEKYSMADGTDVFLDIPQRPNSILAIRKKLLGRRLTEQELAEIMKDVGVGKLQDAEVAFFIATFFNVGFDDDEIYWMTKGLAESGDMMDFKFLKDNGELVVDKHSFGGVAGKGVTPVLVSILAAGGLIVPNTSTRAITSPAGTSDILETVMPVGLSKDKIYEVVQKTGGCLIWGGALNLAPADDVLISIERMLEIQDFQKVLVSIVAKKVCMGINHVLVDLPYGQGTKIASPEELSLLKREFRKLFERFGIHVEVIGREIYGPDGRSIGPNMEMQEVLRILERREDRSLGLEKDILEMAGILFESTGKAGNRDGREMAEEILNSKKALEKFWEIAMAQGAQRAVTVEDLKVGDIVYEVKAEKDGVVGRIDNKTIIKIARALGNPTIKEAGIRIGKMPKDEYKTGDTLLTLYAASPDRMENAKELIDSSSLYD